MLRLKFRRERLRLLEEVFCPRVSFYGVQDDADALHELVEERQVGWAEPLEGREFQDRLHGALE